MAKIINLNPPDKRPHFAIMAMCLICNHRWMGVVVASASLFELTCPMCESQKSFASFLPNGYLAELSKLPDPPSAG